MEPDVLRSMVKWPDVPDVYGWLKLDRHGRWLLRGVPVKHPRSKAFITGNYAVDERGCWFFQNGPQRVFVELEAAPWVFHWVPPHWTQQGGKPVTQVDRAFLCSEGMLFLQTNWGPGLISHLDLGIAAERLCQGNGEPLTAMMEQLLWSDAGSSELPPLFFNWQETRVPLEHLGNQGAAQRLGFVLKPAPQNLANT